jgi:hypothetical protein
LPSVRLVYIAMLRIAVSLLGCATLVAQQAGPPGRGGGRRAAPQSAQQPVGPPGSLRGQVVSVTGEPVRKAEVSLRSVSSRPERQFGSFVMTTDATGVFAFDDVPPGSYAVTVQRNGFVLQDGGLRPGQPFVVESGQAVTGMIIKLAPHGVISGKVLDEDGEALDRVSVQVQRERWVRGQRQLLAVSAGTTNDLGEYRVPGLPAGRYFVVVSRGRQFMRSGSGRAPASPESNYTTTYFPNVIDPAQATLVDISQGQETRGIDFQLRKVPTYRVRGRVADAGGTFTNVSVMIISGSGGPPIHNAGVRSQDGTFELRGVASGNYTLIATRMNIDRSRSTGQQQITVGSRDLDGVVLPIGLDVEVSGTIRGDSDAPLNLGSVRIMLEPVSNLPVFGGTQAAAINGAFRMYSVKSGVYRVRVSGLPEGTCVKSIRQGPQELPESGLQISGPAAPIEIVLGTNAPAITGTVNDSNNRPSPNVSIALVPDAPNRSRYQLYATTTTADTGAFTFRNVAPGDYKVFLLSEGEVDRIQNPAFLSQIESRGTSLRLAEGKVENLQLSLR